jgi:hypothetical protein
VNTRYRKERYSNEKNGLHLIPDGKLPTNQKTEEQEEEKILEI